MANDVTGSRAHETTRRSVIAAAGAGIVSVALPSAASAVSTDGGDGGGGGGGGGAYLGSFTGGALDTESVAGYTLVRFDESGTFEIVGGTLRVGVLLVGGGGGGGGGGLNGWYGGGGGGGSVTEQILDLDTGLYDVTVGAGGAGGTGSIGSSGGTSRIHQGAIDHAFASGGDGGESAFQTAMGGNSASGQAGGSGGFNSGGGGGGRIGAGGVGGEGSGGIGGSGTVVGGFGPEILFLGGGGGGSGEFSGGNGADGGGDGAADFNTPERIAGLAGSGGGGGGGTETQMGGAGGTGVVILKYLTE